MFSYFFKKLDNIISTKIDENKMNKYYFQDTRFVPGYNDIDFDDYTVEATDEKEAWELLDKYTKMFTWKSVGLTHINGVKVKKEAV